MFSHPCIYYVASERLEGEEQFHSKNYLLEIPRSHAKKCQPQKLNIFIAEALSKSYNLHCICKFPSTFPPSYA